MRWWTSILGVMTALQVVGGSRILFLSPLSSKSHKNFYMGILEPMAERGHQIKLITPYKSSKLHKNIQEVVLPDMEISNFISENMFTGNRMTGPLTLAKNSPNICCDALAKPQVQALLEEKFDLVMMSVFFSDCFLSIVHKLKVPYVYVCPGPLFGPFVKLGGSVSFPSFANNGFFTYKHPYTFLQRIIITLSNLSLNAILNYYVNNGMENECRRRGLCPHDMPSIPDMYLNSSLTLINSIKTLESPAEPSVPTTIYCGGIHCRPSKPLPQDLEEWVNGAGEHGFIFFSLGSAVPASSMPDEYMKALLGAFGSLKQRVLFKFDMDTIDGLPPNVRLGKWLPQQDILGHPKLRLFITHGGLLSTLESLYHGIPIMGMPVFGDQQSNMHNVEQNGWGKVLNWEDLSAESLKEKISEVMNDVSMKEEVKQRSVVMKDQPQRPEDVAVYWLEYVLRHHGAPHLVSPVREMPWYKLYNVDVWLTLIVTEIIILYASFRALRALCLYLFCGSRKHKHD